MHKLTGILTICLLMAIIVVGIIESVPPPVEIEKRIIHKRSDQMRVAMIGEPRAKEEGIIFLPVYVAKDLLESEMHLVTGYGTKFVGPLHEGDLVFVTISTTNNQAGYERIVGITVDYRITEEDIKNAE